MPLCVAEIVVRHGGNCYCGLPAMLWWQGVVFVSINVFQIGLLLQERMQTTLSDREQAVYEQVCLPAMMQRRLPRISLVDRVMPAGVGECRGVTLRSLMPTAHPLALRCSPSMGSANQNSQSLSGWLFGGDCGLARTPHHRGSDSIPPHPPTPPTITRTHTTTRACLFLCLLLQRCVDGDAATN